MNQREFKNHMLRGLGRCVWAVQKDPERYRDAVLWGCTHDIAFDAQCEGTKAEYLYNLIACYPDKAPFVQAMARSLAEANPKRSWKIAQQTQLLLFLPRMGTLLPGRLCRLSIVSFMRSCVPESADEADISTKRRLLTFSVR